MSEPPEDTKKLLYIESLTIWNYTMLYLFVVYFHILAVEEM